MQRLSSFRPLLFALVFSLPALGDGSFNRPSDWRYSRVSTPFALFYNPAVLGNNPGYTFGMDMRYLDSSDYDIRGAVVIPITAAGGGGGNRYFRYANTAYRSSGTAVSVGGIYSADSNYRLSAGFVTPVYNIQTGASFDFAWRGDRPVASVNAALAANAPRLMNGWLFYLGFNNVVVSERDSINDFNVSIGAAGVSASNRWLFFVPYDLVLCIRTAENGISRTEAMARFNLDLSPLNTAGGKFGQTPAGMFGYGFVREKGGRVTHKYVASLGIVFVNKSSTATFLGGYNDEKIKYGAASYSALGKTGSDTDKGLFANLGYAMTNDGKILFGLKSGGTTVRSWVLKIEDPDGASVKTYSGGNVVPSSVLWDGRSSDGAEVKDELVFAKLVLKGESRVVESRQITVELRR